MTILDIGSVVKKSQDICSNERLILWLIMYIQLSQNELLFQNIVGQKKFLNWAKCCLYTQTKAWEKDKAAVYVIDDTTAKAWRLTTTIIVHNSIIKQVAHCDRNCGSQQNGIVAHSYRTDGSFGCRLFSVHRKSECGSKNT